MSDIFQYFDLLSIRNPFESFTHDALFPHIIFISFDPYTFLIGWKQSLNLLLRPSIQPTFITFYDDVFNNLQRL